MKCEWKTRNGKRCKKKAAYEVVSRTTGRIFGNCCGTHRPSNKTAISRLLK